MIKKEGRGTEGRNKARVNERVIAITKNCASESLQALALECHCSMDLICLEVVSSFKCFVVYLTGRNTHCRELENTHHHWHPAL